MKRNFYILFMMTLLSNFAIAQVEINPGELVLDARGDVQLFEEFTITNNSDTEMGLFWSVDLADDYPSDWESQICDINLCYGWGTYASSPAAPNMIAAGATVTFSIKTQHKTTDQVMQGTSHVIFRLFDDSDMTNEVAATTAPTVSTSNIKELDLVIYPNPTTNTFMIKNDNSVSHINIYNVVGSQVRSVRHSTGMAHDVTDLRTGMYLVRLLSDDGKTLKSMRLSKK